MKIPMFRRVFTGGQLHGGLVAGLHGGLVASQRWGALHLDGHGQGGAVGKTAVWCQMKVDETLIFMGLWTFFDLKKHMGFLRIFMNFIGDELMDIVKWCG